MMSPVKTVQRSYHRFAKPLARIVSSILLFTLLTGTTMATCASQEGCQACPADGCCGTRDICSCRRTTEEVKKQCWKVSCKKICIPPIRFPWQCGGLAGCGKVRTVRVLEQEASKETEHGYQWTVRTVRTGCGCRDRARGARCADVGHPGKRADTLSPSKASQEIESHPHEHNYNSGQVKRPIVLNYVRLLGGNCLLLPNMLPDTH